MDLSVDSPPSMCSPSLVLDHCDPILALHVEERNAVTYVRTY
jgi:hypothetical protein